MSPNAENKDAISRRDFVRKAGLLGSAAVVAAGAGLSRAQQAGDSSSSASLSAPGSTVSGPMPMRPFGKTGVQVSILGLGGFHIGIPKDESEGIGLIHEAIDSGITFMDNAWDYHDGRSEERMGKALKDGRRDKVFLMTKVCTHGRDGKVAMQQLEQSLKRLQTDHLDLWQIHEVAYASDPELHFAKGGVAEALLKAREQGKVRFLGFTGHKSPELHQEMLDHDFPFDAVQMPLNVFDASFRSFEQNILPKLKERGIAVIGMKSFGGTAAMIKQGAITAEQALRYAMSLPVTVTVSGMESANVLRQNLQLATGFQPMSSQEMAALRQEKTTLAADGRFELYKVTAMFEGPEGRKQHGFPSPKEVGA